MASAFFHHLSWWKARWINYPVFICENNETSPLSFFFLILLHCVDQNLKKKKIQTCTHFYCYGKSVAADLGVPGGFSTRENIEREHGNNIVKCKVKHRKRLRVGRGRGGNYNQAKSTLLFPRGLQTTRFRLHKSAVLTDLKSLICSVRALWRLESV